MAYGVLIHRSDSIYDDSPAEKYQFPKQYLGRIQQFIGDWIVYYEPTKAADARGYFAVARVQTVIQDPSAPEMYLAVIEPGSFLEFSNPVPFKDHLGLLERGLLNEAGGISGRAQSAVRPLSSEDFKRIVERGLEEAAPLLPRKDSQLQEGFSEALTPFVFDEKRTRAVFEISKIVRDRIFRKIVLSAYDQRCAITGLRFINGGGRAEVDAAHIRAVGAGGPDIVSNGIALSGTAHWMFDRGLISLSDDLEILVSRQTNNPEEIRSFINSTGRALAPLKSYQRPHPHFLEWHRTHCFKQ